MMCILQDPASFSQRRRVRCHKLQLWLLALHHLLKGNASVVTGAPGGQLKRLAMCLEPQKCSWTAYFGVRRVEKPTGEVQLGLLPLSIAVDEGGVVLQCPSRPADRG